MEVRALRNQSAKVGEVLHLMRTSLARDVRSMSPSLPVVFSAILLAVLLTLTIYYFLVKR